ALSVRRQAQVGVGSSRAGGAEDCAAAAVPCQAALGHQRGVLINEDAVGGNGSRQIAAACVESGGESDWVTVERQRAGIDGLGQQGLVADEQQPGSAGRGRRYDAARL